MGEAVEVGPRPGSGRSIGRLMAAIAALATLLGALRDLPSTGLVAGVLLLLGLCGLLGSAAVAATFGTRCPACGLWRLAQVRAAAFGHRYYRCEDCAARVKRRPLGPWEDASGAADDPHFRPRGDAGRWAHPPASVDERGTAGTLLANHRRRVAEAPPPVPGVPSAD